MQKILLAAAAVAVVAGGAYVYKTLSFQPAAPAQILQTQSEPGAVIDTSAVFEAVSGNPEARVEIIEYSSFTCPHCANFNQGVYRQIRENFVETGQVHYIKREVYFDAYGLWAALIARCGGPERYDGIVEMIYEGQREWATQPDAAGVAASLRRIGRRAGLSDDQLNACLENREMATAMMETYRVNADGHSIRSTPSFVINGTTHSNMSYAEFERVITAAAGQ